MKRALPVLALLAVFIVGGALAGYLYVSAPRGETVAWTLTGMGGANSAAGQDVVGPNVVRVHVDRWPVEDFAGSEWLTSSVDYGPDEVTITLRVSDAYKARTAGYPTIGWYDTGGWVNVRLRDPLPTQAKLRDGATGAEYIYLSATPHPF